ncbi:hypothetical protein [Limnospira platensis]|uniref:hypothetical protein n=1 Tax=Limnospira platensis TaxID=118562 RepID=UPI00028042E6|nr:hypothetical protein SPLC1_S520410 [Arthrospira platensis C1]UWU48363.1 hypothetical protein APLC1_3156 [Arthrospira platensis C1]
MSYPKLFGFKHYLLWATALVLAMGGLIRAQANSPQTYSFSTEFQGGILQGTFTGYDANNNGMLEQQELTSFVATYNGFNTEPTTANWNQSHIRRFQMDLNSQKIILLAIATQDIPESGVNCSLEFILRLGGYVEGRDLIEIERSSGFFNQVCLDKFPNLRNHETQFLQVNLMN